MDKKPSKGFKPFEGSATRIKFIDFKIASKVIIIVAMTQNMDLEV
jgi:hypothetical protein